MSRRTVPSPLSQTPTGAVVLIFVCACWTTGYSANGRMAAPELEGRGSREGARGKGTRRKGTRRKEGSRDDGSYLRQRHTIPECRPGADQLPAVRSTRAAPPSRRR